jgi:hypothetical protein
MRSVGVQCSDFDVTTQITARGSIQSAGFPAPLIRNGEGSGRDSLALDTRTHPQRQTIGQSTPNHTPQVDPTIAGPAAPKTCQMTDPWPLDCGKGQALTNQHGGHRPPISSPVAVATTRTTRVGGRAFGKKKDDEESSLKIARLTTQRLGAARLEFALSRLTCVFPLEPLELIEGFLLRGCGLCVGSIGGILGA